MELVVSGFEGRQNKLFIYCPPKPVQNVMFFQGDAQVCLFLIQYYYKYTSLISGS